MAIVSGDIKYRLSGGASNTDPAASLGGAMSSTDAGSNLLDNVSSTEGAAGDVEYRCYYIHNNHGSLTMIGAKAWIQANTPSAESTLDIGLGTTAVGTGNEQSVADESTAPSGVTFSAAANEGAALSIGDIPAGHHKAIWVRRTITAGAAAASDTATLRTKCDTLP